MLNADKDVLRKIQAEIGKTGSNYAGCAKLLLLRLYKRPQGYKIEKTHCGDVKLLVDLGLARIEGGLLVLNQDHADVARLSFMQ